MAVKKKKKPEIPARSKLEYSQIIDGKMWLKGTGPEGASVMLIFEAPYAGDVDTVTLLGDPAWEILWELAKKAGLDLSDYYITYSIKFLPDKPKTPSQKEFKECFTLLKEEIKQVNPDLIVTFGSRVPKLFFGKGSSLSSFAGGIAESKDFPGIKFLPLNAPSYVLRFADAEIPYIRNLHKITQGGIEVIPEIEFEIIDSVPKADAFVQKLLKEKPRLLSLDCEWHGLDRTDTLNLRTVQIKCPNYPTGVFKFKECLRIESVVDEKAECKEDEVIYKDIEVIDNTFELPEEAMVWSLLKTLLEDKDSNIIGHNVREDGKHLLVHDINIRENTVYDTMIAEHCINSSGPFDLSSLSCRYTDFGRYDIDLENWKLDNKPICKNGYGAIPDDILFKYGAYDVEAPIEIMKKQLEPLTRYLEPRGKYPSLYDTALRTADILYELELVGMLVDQEQLKLSTKQYQTARSKLLKIVQKTVAEITNNEILEFNPDSYKQKSTLLFKTLKLAPTKTTSKPIKQWSWVQRQAPDVQAKYNPAVDQETLELLINNHPVIEQMLDYSRVNTICKNFLRNDDNGGIRGNTWTDGRIHARFSQLSSTGRFKHREPNVANFPKAAEAKLKAIMGDDVDSVRNVIIADDGYSFVEGDFTQAELFVLANLSYDTHFINILQTPGKDLHDTTTLKTFGYTRWYPDNSPCVDEEMIALAKADPDLYDEIKSLLLYKAPNGEVIDSKAFKLVRVAGKAVNFGIPYGRSAAAIQRQVAAEAGLKLPVETFQTGIDAWHKEYAIASAFMKRNGELGISKGFAENPFKRRRLFPKVRTQMDKSSIRREAGNAVIQSTVADALQLSMGLLIDERGSLNFRIVNPIHDALMLLVKDSDIDATSRLLKDVLESIEIPLPKGGHFSLGADIEVCKRWK